MKYRSHGKLQPSHLECNKVFTIQIQTKIGFEKLKREGGKKVSTKKELILQNTFSQSFWLALLATKKLS